MRTKLRNRISYLRKSTSSGQPALTERSTPLIDCPPVHESTVVGQDVQNEIPEQQVEEESDFDVEDILNQTLAETANESINLGKSTI